MKLDLDRCQAICDAATKRAWWVETHTNADVRLLGRAEPDTHFICTGMAGFRCQIGRTHRLRDAVFIITARTAMPELIARVRELEARIEKLEEGLPLPLVGEPGW